MKLYPMFFGSAALVSGLTGAARQSGTLATSSGACELVTRTEAAAALGAPVPAGSEKPMDFPLDGSVIKMEICFYGSEVLIARYSLGSGAPALFARYRQSLSTQDGYQNVNGVGDEAFAAKGQLYVRKGQTGVNIDVGQTRGGGAKELQAEKGLAALAVSRL